MVIEVAVKTEGRGTAMAMVVAATDGP